MKKSPLKKIGKRGKINLEANRKLKEVYREKGIMFCELRFDGCFINNYLGFAHFNKRREYIKNPELLADFNETLLACHPCHQKLEQNRNLTEQMFKTLRPARFAD